MSPSRVRIPPSPLTLRSARFTGETSFPRVPPSGVMLAAGVSLLRGTSSAPRRFSKRPSLRCTRPRRGGRAVECGGLENRFGLLGPTRVQIPPPPLYALLASTGGNQLPPVGFHLGLSARSA